MEDPGPWPAAADLVVEELLARCRVDGPPVDAVRLAGRLGIDIVVNGAQPERGRHKRIDGRSTVFLRPEERPERMQWAAAHEVGEVVIADVFQRAGAVCGQDSPELRERAANLFASRLLLPSRWFPADARRSKADLFWLKDRYRTASHELIAYRLLDLEEASIVTIFDQGRITRRRTNHPPGPPRLFPAEHACWDEVRTRRRPHQISSQGLFVRGWPIYEAGWRREVLRTTVEEEWC